MLVVTDVFSKWVEAFAIPSTGAEVITNKLVKEVICRYGVPEGLHSDQGANLRGEVVQKICDKLGIHRTQTSAYHPQGNGHVERFNRTIAAMLAKHVNKNQKDWDTHIPQVLMAYRTAVHESTGFSPYHLVFGRSPKLPLDIMLGRVTDDEKATSLPEYVQDLHRSLEESFKLARENLTLSH